MTKNDGFNRASWYGGKGTSAEVSAITTSSPGHSGFNIPSAGALDSLREIVGTVAAQIPELSKKKIKKNDGFGILHYLDLE